MKKLAGCSSFFDESKEQSQVKAQIVAKYLWAWAKVVTPTAKKHGGRIAYVDLFAGPGRYADGTKSTPLLVLERAIQDPDMRDMLVTIFNDKAPGLSESLQAEIGKIPGIVKLRHEPQVHNVEVGQEIVQIFQDMPVIPTLFFVDPCGYKGLSIDLINSVLKDWGCDCIIFFNYNRINMGLNNPAVKEHMDALFGEERAAALIEQLEVPITPQKRELIIEEAICQALKAKGGKYVLRFRFTDSRGTRTSHHLIFVTKHIRGYEIMKEIMARESSSEQQGVASFEYNPAIRNQPVLFEILRPLDDLANMLLGEFAGRTMTMVEVYKQHHIGKRYIKANYKAALLKLESEGRIKVNPPADRRLKRKGKATLAERVTITFPPGR